MTMQPVSQSFFQQLPTALSKALLGKVLCARHGDLWLMVQIIETEAYYLNEKGSHSSKGRTPSREAMFMPAGTIYMYYSRGHDSMNISAEGEGNAILVKAGIPFLSHSNADAMIKQMQANTPLPNGQPRPPMKLCAGQTLLCKSLGITVKQWNCQQFDPQKFYLADPGYTPKIILQTTRLGIPADRDAHLLHRYIDAEYTPYCSSNPLTKRKPPPINQLT